MLVEVVPLILVGAVVALLPLHPGYRRRSTRKLAERVGARIPAEQEAALEARTARRPRAVDAGIASSSAVLGLWHLVTGRGLPAAGGGWVLIGLTFSPAAALATGQVGPGWVGALLVVGYALVPVLLLVAVGRSTLSGGDNERTRFRRRLWSTTKGRAPAGGTA